MYGYASIAESYAVFPGRIQAPHQRLNRGQRKNDLPLKHAYEEPERASTASSLSRLCLGSDRIEIISK